MSNSKPLSRREWFRLRPKPQSQMLGKDTQSGGDNVLKSIEHPPNHDGLDLAELPPMREAILSETQVNTLFSDIENLATDILLMQRTPRSSRASAPKVSSAQQLELTKAALFSGQQQRVQIRYQWQSALWIDTLENRSEGYRLVRITHRSP